MCPSRRGVRGNTTNRAVSEGRGQGKAVISFVEITILRSRSDTQNKGHLLPRELGMGNLSDFKPFRIEAKHFTLKSIVWCFARIRPAIINFSEVYDIGF